MQTGGAATRLDLDGPEVLGYVALALNKVREVSKVARKRSGFSQTRSLLYGLARLLGDVSATGRGPRGVGKRLVRRAAGRVAGLGLRRLFK